MAKLLIETSLHLELPIEDSLSQHRIRTRLANILHFQESELELGQTLPFVKPKFKFSLFQMKVDTRSKTQRLAQRF